MCSSHLYDVLIWFFIFILHNVYMYIYIQYVAKSIGACNKSHYLINQNHICSKKILWSHFWIDFNKLYTKIFGIVHILIVYLRHLVQWWSPVHVFFAFVWCANLVFYFYFAQCIILLLFCYIHCVNTINHICSKKILWSHFWIDFNKLYTKIFGIIHILIVYLLIMLLWVIFMWFLFVHNLNMIVNF
jgi:hypothetical protein